MLFNSINFLLFFAVVYPLYFILKHRWQNWLLIIASCIFYAMWNWKFLFLMFASITTDYICAKCIDQTVNQRTKKRFLFLSIFVNLSILGFFKYYNFFESNIEGLLKNFHILSPQIQLTFNIILPLGISFYTFEAISYVVDVYRKIVKPAEKYEDYLLYVIFFPHLIAGPIMRAKDLLWQIATPRQVDLPKVFQGSHLFFWGLFEKIFIADNLAKIVNPVFASRAPYHGAQVVVALYAFAFQIFCDFDGYSNMARGLGKVMGFEITINFKLPYFASNPTEFWQRWHISLSSWLRDYLYIPLGGNRHGEFYMYRNLLITMLLGGLWHGASWTFVLWGFYHGLLLCTYKALERGGGFFNEIKFPGARLISTVFFFNAVVLGWLFFRSTDLHQVKEMLYAISARFQGSEFIILFPKLLSIIAPLMIVQIGQWKSQDLMFLYKVPSFIKIAAYALLTYLILAFGLMRPEKFIYFQF